MQLSTQLLSMILVVATSLQIGLYSYLSHVRSTNTRFSYQGEDHPRTLPIKPLRHVAMYAHNTVHLQMASSTGVREWELQSPGDGLVYLGPRKRPFMVGMLHELRCLDVMRRAILHASSNGSLTSKEDGLLSRQTRHCMDYLREMALCHMNTRVEWVTSVEPRRSVWEGDYVCRDWSLVYNVVKANQVEYAEWKARQPVNG